MAAAGRAKTPRSHQPKAGNTLPEETNCGRLPAMRLTTAAWRAINPTVSAVPSHLPGYMPFDGRVKTLASSPNHSIDEGLTDFFDINSDGCLDVLVTAPGLYSKDHALLVNGQNGQLGFGGPQNMAIQGVLGADATSIKLSNPNMTPFDLDGDGRINLVHVPPSRPTPSMIRQQIGGKWTWVGRAIETANAQNIKIDLGSDTLDTQVMDVDFDGLVDVSVSTGRNSRRSSPRALPGWRRAVRRCDADRTERRNRQSRSSDECAFRIAACQYGSAMARRAS